MLWMAQQSVQHVRMELIVALEQQFAVLALVVTGNLNSLKPVRYSIFSEEKSIFKDFFYCSFIWYTTYISIYVDSCQDKITPVACTKGNYDSADKMSCETCPIGHYCPSDQLVVPIPCANGTYQNETGQETCHQCPSGQKCPSKSSVPVDCPDGTYSLLGVDDCSICPTGFQ